MYLSLTYFSAIKLFCLRFKAKKKSSCFQKLAGWTFFITHQCAQLNVYQNIYFQFQKTNKQAKKTRIQKAEKTKEGKRISLENWLKK